MEQLRPWTGPAAVPKSRTSMKRDQRARWAIALLGSSALLLIGTYLGFHSHFAVVETAAWILTAAMFGAGAVMVVAIFMIPRRDAADVAPSLDPPMPTAPLSTPTRWACAVGFGLAALGVAALATLHNLVWNPRAEAPGLSLEQIYVELEVGRREVGSVTAFLAIATIPASGG